MDAADAGLLVRRALRREGNRVWFHPHEPYDLDAFGQVFVAGAGKAAGPMAQAGEALLEDRLAGGVVAVPTGTPASDRPRRLEVVEAEHPLPGAGSLRAAEALTALARHAGPRDLVVFLVSGGASSLMAAPEPGLDLDDLREVWDVLLRSGLDIHEANIARKHLMTLGGGKFARMASRASIVSLILSDVPGNRLETVGSGPTVADRSTIEDAEQVLARAGALPPAAHRLRSFLERAVGNVSVETPKPHDPLLQRVYNRLVGSNEDAAAGAIFKAAELGYHDGGDFRRRSPLPPAAPEAHALGRSLGTYAAYLAKTMKLGYTDPKPMAVIAGGEAPSGRVRRGGRGGRVSAFTLAAARPVEGARGVVVGGLATDGRDGSWDASGALADGATIARAQAAGLSPDEVVASSDSGAVFEAAGGKIPAWPSRTNVADLYIALVVPD